MIILRITHTIKDFNPRAQWFQSGNTEERFTDMKQANEWINEIYGKHKKQPMYIDTKEGKTKKIGFIIGFKDEEYEGGKWIKFLRQDWIEFSQCELIEL
jgi:hypothetical protein